MSMRKAYEILETLILIVPFIIMTIIILCFVGYINVRDGIKVWRGK